MPQFRYHAQTAEGEARSGLRDAADEDDLRAQLAAEGLQLLQYERLEQTAEDATARDPGQVRSLPRRDVEDLALHLSDVVQAGLPLSEGLAALAAEIPSGRLRKTLSMASQRLRSGDDLAEVLTELKLPQDFTRLVKVGLQSGRLSDVLTQYAAQRRKAAELRSWFLGALTYPVLICSLALLLVLAVLYWLVPMFAATYDVFEVDLPVLTRGMIWVSQAVREDGWWLLLLAAFFAAGMALIWRMLLTPLARDSVRAALPLAGGAFRMLGMARFAEMLAILIEHQQPLPTALRYAGEGCGDELTRRAAAGLADEVEAGQPLGTAAPLLPDFPVSLLETCEQHQFRSVLPDVLRTLAEMYVTRLRGDAATLAFILEPALLIACGGFLFLVVVSLFSPLIMLLNSLS